MVKRHLLHILLRVSAISVVDILSLVAACGALYRAKQFNDAKTHPSETSPQGDHETETKHTKLPKIHYSFIITPFSPGIRYPKSMI